MELGVVELSVVELSVVLLRWGGGMMGIRSQSIIRVCQVYCWLLVPRVSTDIRLRIYQPHSLVTNGLVSFRHYIVEAYHMLQP